MTRDLDPDRILALAYVPATKRPALEALWRLDVTLGAVLAKGGEAMVTRIRLAWWREALERLDATAPPAEPLLQALAGQVLPAGVSGAELAAMEEGWEAIVAPRAIDAEALEIFARERGARLFNLSARLLGDDGFAADDAGRCWALVDFARHARDGRERDIAQAEARALALPRRWPFALRPLGMLAMLARRDAQSPAPGRQGSPSRMVRMLVHRLTGA